MGGLQRAGEDGPPVGGQGAVVPGPPPVGGRGIVVTPLPVRVMVTGAPSVTGTVNVFVKVPLAVGAKRTDTGAYAPGPRAYVPPAATEKGAAAVNDPAAWALPTLMRSSTDRVRLWP